MSKREYYAVYELGLQLQTLDYLGESVVSNRESDNLYRVEGGGVVLFLAISYIDW